LPGRRQFAKLGGQSTMLACRLGAWHQARKK
jgi:hypothetical protein